MPSPAQSDNAERDTLVIALPTIGTQITKFVSYALNESFFTPCDGCQFKIAGDTIPDAVNNALLPNVKVQITINGLPQSTGRITKVTRMNSRAGGTEIDVEYKDILGPVVDSCADPTMRFNASMTLYDVISTVLSTFGLSTYATDNYANLNVITGQTKGQPSKRKKLKAFLIHQLKPYPREGAFAFLSRICNRFGLWLWPSADGQTIIFGKPDGMDDDGNYTMPPSRYKLIRKIGGSQNNILDGSVTLDADSQPSVILATGAGAGGGVDFPKASLRSALINPLVTTDLTALQARYPSTAFKTLAIPNAAQFGEAYPRPVFLHDDESKNQGELDAFCRREMTMSLRKGVVARYTIPGHTIGGSPVAVDSIVDVDDDRGNLHQPMWVESRTFLKSAGQGGTMSTLNLILPGCVVL